MTTLADETIYLVGTPERAALVQAHIDAARTNADVQGAPQPRARVVVEGTTEADLLLRIMGDIAPSGMRLLDQRFS